MWCDDFDMDLIRVFDPEEINRLVEPVADLRLFTHGKTTNGVLNHPSVWNDFNGCVAFFGLGRPGNEAAKSNSFWTPDPLVECSVLEMLRDWWPHTYNVKVEGKPILGTYRREFDLLMADLREWMPATPSERDKARSNVLSGIARAMIALEDIHWRCNSGHCRVAG